MKRPLVYCTICYITGILAARQYYNIVLPVGFILCGLFSCRILAVGCGGRRFHALPMAALFFAAGYFLFHVHNHVLENKYACFEGNEITVTGSVSDVREGEYGPVYTVKTSKVYFNEHNYNIKGLIQVYAKAGSGNVLRCGSRVSARGMLNLPRGKRNPGGFDHRLYLKGRKISALMNAGAIEETGPPPRFSVKLAALNVRSRIVNVINKCLPREEAGLLSGMLIGYREDLTEDMEDAFRDAGLTHIMAVSGANVLFIALPFAFIFKKAGIPRRISNLIISGILFFFVFITGFSASVVRAVIMAVTALFAQILYRETDVLTSIAFSAFVLLVYNPFLLYDIGFQLSYAATLSLVFLYNPFREKLKLRFIPKVMADILAATMAAQAGVLPISTWHFNRISLVSPVSNLLALPVVQVVTILGTVTAALSQVSIPVARLPAFINYFPLKFIISVTSFCARIPHAAINVPTPELHVVFLYYFLLVFVFIIAPKIKLRLKIKHLIAFAVCIALIAFVKSMIPRKLEVVFIDVGQGDAILVSTPAGKSVLIDGGGSFSGEGSADTGNKIVLPLLMDYGIRKLDAVVATHPHSDHLQGLFAVVEKMPVKSIILPDNPLVLDDFRDFLSLAESRDVPVSFCSRGSFISLDRGVRLVALHPDKNRPLAESPANNASLVLKLEYGNTKILLTGDIEKAAEEMLVEVKNDLSSLFLKVPHHGSSTSTGPALLEAVNPAVAVISVGSNNFGHPSQAVIERLEKAGCKIYRTDRCGAVRLVSDGRTVKVYTMA